MNATARLVCGACRPGIPSVWDEEFLISGSCSECGRPLDLASAASEAVTVDHSSTPRSRVPALDGSDARSTKEAAPIPERVGRFHPRERIGGGSFGEVYRAYDPRLDRDVALKVLREVNPSARVVERFFREARAAARLDHPNIVPLHDAGRDGDRSWIAYQFISGQTLSRLIDLRTFRASEAVRLIRALAGAVDYAHRHGILHRDLKPSNVLLDQAGRPRLTDFGLARRIEYEPGLTQEGMILGTPPYMSPEQSTGRSHDTDVRSDVYSLGAILHELLSGRRPPVPPGALTPRRAEPHPAPNRAPRPIPRSLARICSKALEFHPVDRYHDARALADDLDHWLERRRATLARLWLAAALVVGFLIRGLL